MEIKLIINGETKYYDSENTYLEIAREYQSQYSDEIALVKVNNSLRELNKRPDTNGTLEFVTLRDTPGKDTYRRSAVMLLMSATDRLYPKRRINVKFSLGQGYYCEMIKDGEVIAVTKECLEEIKAEMERLVSEDIVIAKESMHLRDARRMADEAGSNDRLKLLKYRRSSYINMYDIAGYKDYYYGYMLPSTGYIKHFDLVGYQNGFMLMFAEKDNSKAAEFVQMNKLFSILDESSKWADSIGIGNVGELNDAIAQGKILDLILVQEAWMEQKIGEIAGMIAEDSRRKFIMIAGPSSSGKTTFSHRLSVQLRAHGLNPHPIALDDFYVNREETPKDENGEYDYECLEAIDVECFNDSMTRLLNGESVLLPVYNFKTGKREYRNEKMKLGADDVLVIEGIHGLNEKLSYALPKENKFKIYISALTAINIDEHNCIHSSDARLLRRIIRDARTRNTSARANLARWKSVRGGEEKNIFPFQEEADVMINSSLVYELAVIKVFAEPLLFGIDNSCPEYPEAKRLLKFLDYLLPVPAEEVSHNSILREFVGGGCFNI